MKKLFFTAIAMVAFSSASMANTIADAKKDNIIKNKKNYYKTINQLRYDC